MPRGGTAEVGDLSLDPELIEGGLQDVLNLPREPGNGENLAGREESHVLSLTERPARCKRNDRGRAGSLIGFDFFGTFG